MADTAPVLIWVSGRDNRLTFFNRGWFNFTGRSVTQELGDGWIAGVHPDDRERCISTYFNAFEAREDFQLEYRLRRYDGEYRWIIGRKNDPDGQEEVTVKDLKEMIRYVRKKMEEDERAT